MIILWEIKCLLHSIMGKVKPIRTSNIMVVVLGTMGICDQVYKSVCMFGREMR